MTSIRLRLFLILVASTGILWMCAAAWIYFGTRAKVENLLDPRLVEAATMVDSLVSSQRIDAWDAPSVAA